MPIIDSNYANNHIGNVGDYVILQNWFCEQTYLRINKGKIRGYIVTSIPGFHPFPNPDTIGYADFKTSWNISSSYGSLCHKIKLIVGINEILIPRKKMKAFSNPVKEVFYLESTIIEKLSFQLYNLMRQEVFLRSSALSPFDPSTSSGQAAQGDQRKKIDMNFLYGI